MLKEESLGQIRWRNLSEKDLQLCDYINDLNHRECEKDTGDYRKANIIPG